MEQSYQPGPATQSLQSGGRGGGIRYQAVVMSKRKIIISLIGNYCEEILFDLHSQESG